MRGLQTVSGDIPTKQREAADARDQGQCVRCGMSASDKHHRKRRRDGGHVIENIISVCRACHAWIHGHPKQAIYEGFIIHFNEQNIASVPMRSYMGWVFLTPEGGVAFDGSDRDRKP